MKNLLVCTLLLCLILLFSGCTGTDDSDKHTLKMEFTGENTGEITGVIEATPPGPAGFVRKNIIINAPGSVEVKVGPASYDVRLSPVDFEKVAFNLYFDGTKLEENTHYKVAVGGGNFTFQVDTRELVKSE